jgi:hypothetical protein
LGRPDASTDKQGDESEVAGAHALVSPYQGLLTMLMPARFAMAGLPQTVSAVLWVGRSKSIYPQITTDYHRLPQIKKNIKIESLSLAVK